MILEKQKEAFVQQEGETQESIGMSLDLDSAQILMQMLSKNLYSDAIGSTVRECASNALDSHRRAGVTDPIVVSFTRSNDNNYEFAVEDFGTGLDADDVRNIISKYGKSTKRNSANELGMMGLGFKAPLAYSSSFYFVCRKDGMERKYMMYEGEDVNTIDLLHEAPTTERNGVKVIIPVNYRDRHNFIDKIKQQLAYFENVYFNIDGFTNDFVIIRHPHFQFSELATDRNLHICLDNVYYPLDYSKLGIDSLYIPIALRFSLTDGIFPTPNREAIRYTEEAKTVILERLQQAADYFIEKYNETVQDTENLKLIYNHFRSSSRNYIIGKNSWDIHPLAKFATIPLKDPKFKGIELLDMADVISMDSYILGEYENKFTVNRKNMRIIKGYHANTLCIRNMQDKVYVYKNKIGGIKKDYIKSLQAGLYNDGIIVRKDKSFTLFNNTGDYDCYYKLLDLKKHPKSEWRARIKEFQFILSCLTKHFVDVDSMEVPQEFIDSRKKQRIATGQIKGVTTRRIKLKGEMTCKIAKPLERDVYGKNCKWVSTTYNMADFHKNPFIFVYGTSACTEEMDKWYKSFNSHVQFAILSEREIKVVNNIELHNLIPFEKFMKGENKPFQRLASASRIDKLAKRYPSVFKNYDILNEISSDLFNKIKQLNEYRKEYSPSANNDTLDTIISHADENNIYDPVIHDVYQSLKAILEKLPFISPLLRSSYYYHGGDDAEILKQSIADLFKYHRHRVDWKNYIKLNEDLPLEEKLEEENIDSLIED